MAIGLVIPQSDSWSLLSGSVSASLLSSSLPGLVYPCTLYLSKMYCVLHTLLPLGVSEEKAGLGTGSWDPGKREMTRKKRNGERAGKGKAEIGIWRECLVFALSCLYKYISLCLCF